MRHPTRWFEATGDETCGRCGKKVTEGEKLNYEVSTDATKCEPCFDAATDERIGLIDSLDPRYSDSPGEYGEEGYV